MLHSFMIISGRGGLVLYRKVFTKAPNQPRLIAGLVTALGEFSVRSIGIPITHIELENVTITALEIPIGNDEAGSDHLRAVLFHDTSDADLYGHSVGLQLLTVFKENYAERLLSLQLANVQGVEDIFKGFGALVRPAIVASVFPLLEFLESNAAIRQAYLVRHGLEGTFRKSLESIWYPSGSRSGSTMIADLQALLAAGDDALASQGDETAVVTIGDDIRVERFDGATLVIVLQPSNTFSSCQDVIGSCSQVLEQLLVLMKGLQGSRGMT